MSDEILDDFRDVSGWSAVASGQAQLRLGRDTGPDGSALRLDYDFRGGGGFVVARKLFARRMPESWAIELQIRGAAPANRLEIKLADPTGRNVWWWHRDAFEFPHYVGAAAHPELGGVVRVGACRWRRAPRARCDRDRDRRRARRRRLGISGALASRGSFAHRTTARARVERDTRSRGGARGRRVARNELAQCVGRDAVDRARLRPRVRVRRHRGRLGARRGGARLRRAELGRRHALDDSLVRAPGRRRAELRLPARRWSLAPPASPPAGSGRGRGCVRDPHAGRPSLRVLAVTRRVLPRRRGGGASRSFSALAASRAVLLDIGRRRGRIERRDHERGGHARARSRLSVARTVPVRGRRAGHVGGRRARDRARARLPADSVLDVAASRSRSDHDGLRRRGSHRSRRACLVPRRERRDDAEARPSLHHAPAVPGDTAVAVVRRARWTRTRSRTVVARRRRRR